MAALFKRDDKTTIAELEEYYANQKKTRRSKAWMMGILSFLITAGVITSLFFAGRWGYQELTKDDGNDTVATTQTTEPVVDSTEEQTDQSEEAEQVELPTFDSESPNEQGVSFEDSSTDDQDDLIIVETPEEQGVVSDEAASITVEPDVAIDTSDNEDVTIDNSETDSPVVAINDIQDTSNDDESSNEDLTDDHTEVAGEQTEIPNTGSNEVLFIFAITAIAGYLFSRSRQISKS